MSYQLWVILDSILFYFLIIPFFHAIKWKKSNIYFRFKYRWEVILLIGSLLFCLYNKTEGDYFHYNEYLQDITSAHTKENIFEPPYMFLISIIGNNYFLFRLFVWGAALLLYTRTLIYAKLFNNISISIFILFVLLAFAYGRVSLALSIFYLGAIYSYINWEKKKYGYVVGGCLIILTSLFFHKSMFVPVLLFIFLCFFRLNFKRIVLLTLLLPIIIYATNTVLSNILALQSAFSQVNRGIYYLATEKEALGLSLTIPLILSFPSLILLMFIIGKDFYSSTQIQIPLYIRKLYEIAFFLMCISFILLFADTGGRYLFIRIKEMSYIAFSIILSYYLLHFKIKKWVLFISVTAIFLHITFYFSYAYYLKSIGSGI